MTELINTYSRINYELATTSPPSCQKLPSYYNKIMNYACIPKQYISITLQKTVQEGCKSKYDKARNRFAKKSQKALLHTGCPMKLAGQSDVRHGRRLVKRMQKKPRNSHNGVNKCSTFYTKKMTQDKKDNNNKNKNRI